MKEVLVGDFIKRLLSEGASLEGCQFKNGSFSYSFQESDGKNIKVLHGENLEKVGYLYKFLRVVSVEVLRTPGERIRLSSPKGPIRINIAASMLRG